MSGNDLYFKYKELECNAEWVLKPSEEGLLIKDDISIGSTIKFNRGILKNLKCNKKLECNDVECTTGDYKIVLDPEILEVKK